MLEAQLFERGFGVERDFMQPSLCREIRAEFNDGANLFRSTVHMERHGFGRGSYRYYGYPLPARLHELRAALYARLAPIANRWSEALGSPQRYPPALPLMLELCAGNEQTRPTVLLLRYHPGDYNALHQDQYGAVTFPFQATVLLSELGKEFEGGEFVLVEQRPRKQSVPHVVPLSQGDLIVFANKLKPAAGPGASRTAFKHGVSAVTRGERYALGIIFHDAP